MKRYGVVLASASIALCSLAAATSAVAGPPPPPKLPDLVITQFGLQSWGKCAPDQVVFTFSVTVKNQGAAGWSGSSDVSARDLKSSGWFTSDTLQPIAPGDSKTVQIKIFYLTQNPGFMSSGSPHPFQAKVNDAHSPTESNFANNTGPGPALWQGKRVIMVAPPKDCGKGK